MLGPGAWDEHTHNHDLPTSFSFTLLTIAVKFLGKYLIFFGKEAERSR
jgi:hypothetical protein